MLNINVYILIYVNCITVIPITNSENINLFENEIVQLEWFKGQILFKTYVLLSNCIQKLAFIFKKFVS